ncbi:neutrophil gelatinase-associated lipocalin-like isoform X1 [Hyaena hyaena]|uniref:neutrophil gelatinase-associated lipocalin-like isoform X1 n=1 Tax=Hyaena hyaena TaxID=95912 RepID=UPI0019208A6E|nr:neutrophil gelatinase-associated lipocalin-like isoform X1 [Hyaena hyaena]XP_039085662.1 neutrophil gelatinase-associated lipocalin-like isoform X1 [Hyaena hyaena]XP_039085663.1 neutrophil gelatinase-associated lipocalin-like isoform X1 [Hyaena hyaena]
MALGPLWLGLALWGALHTQAQDSTPNPIPAPPLHKVPLQPDFQNELFQGKWYILGVAGNEINEEKHSQLKMYTTTYELNEDNSYNVTFILPWNQRCDPWGTTFIPSFQPGLFTLGNIERYPGIQSYTVRVVTTDYNEVATMFFMKVYNNQEFFKITLYGRTKELSPELKENFIGFAKSLGLTDEHIVFPVPNDECIYK